MFSIFKSRKAPFSEVFRDYVDCHSHILPGVDDGVRRVEDSIRILSKYSEIGVRGVWLTSHVMEDCPNTPEGLSERFSYLKNELASSSAEAPELNLSAENMLDALFMERLAEGRVLPHMSNRILVETSCFTPPYNLDGVLEEIKRRGYFPILAHPERYEYMSDADYRKLKGMDILFQLNLPSLVGMYGSRVKAMAEKLLSLGYYEYTGTDLHRYSTLEHMLDEGIGAGTLDKVQKIVSSYR